MNTSLIVAVIQVPGTLCGDLLRLRQPHVKTEDYQPVISVVDEEGLSINVPAAASPPETTDDKIKKGTACLPCTNSHLHACVGLLDEAMRMSPDGINEDSMQRVDKCLGQIAAAERIDLAPENVAALPEKERVVAEYAAKEMREIRHGLEGVTDKKDLERVTLQTITLQEHVGKAWFKIKMADMPKEQKTALVEKALASISEEE